MAEVLIWLLCSILLPDLLVSEVLSAGPAKRCEVVLGRPIWDVYLCIMQQVPVGPCITIFFCSLKYKEDSRAGGWSSFEKKNGGELGHDNILAAFNDWIACLPFTITLMVGPVTTGAGGGSAWPAIFCKLDLQLLTQVLECNTSMLGFVGHISLTCHSAWMVFASVVLLTELADVTLNFLA